VNNPTDPADLDYNDLVEALRTIQAILWLDTSTGTWDPDKEWSADTIEDVGGVLIDNGLNPIGRPHITESEQRVLDGNR